MVEFDGALDPLRVTNEAVQVLGPDGRRLSVRCRVQSGRLVVELEVDAALLSDPPSTLEVALAGLPSVHALGTVDGRWLASATRLHVPVASPRLAPLGTPAVRVVSVGGHGIPPPSPIRLTGSLVLVFDGVLDPSTLGPGSCPLFPVEHGLVLGEPFDPLVSWRCTGRRFEVELDLSGARGRFELDLRQFRVRGLSGTAPEPALKTALSLS
ncbi:MAG: hypothetical protein ACYTG2_02940 [Planctomycetota bacterium]